jgi:hypothetical protein
MQNPSTARSHQSAHGALADNNVAGFPVYDIKSRPLRAGSPAMPKSTPEQTFAKLFNLANDEAAPAHEREAAERKMATWLKRRGKTRRDIQAILVEAAKHDAAANPPPPSDPRDAGTAGPIGKNITPLDVIRRLSEDYFVVDKHEYVAIALWAMHAHVFDQFEHTPRLVVTSPVRHCGKSRVLKVLHCLVKRPKYTSSITQGALYDTLDRLRPTMLIDEADNLGLAVKGELRSILNDGFERTSGCSVDRGVGKQARSYNIFAPIALASIGALTLPLMSRSVVIHMTRTYLKIAACCRSDINVE